MEEKKKKQLILLLLLISCGVSAFLLAFTPGYTPHRLPDFEYADSLIISDLGKFNISSRQIRVRSTPMDSLHTRKTYHVNVPPGFSKTQLHLEFSQTFSAYSVTAPAKVVFPQKDLVIHLIYNQTVFRSIKLQTDPDLELQRNYGSILVAFNNIPSQSLLEKVVSFGEPIPLTLITNNPMHASELEKRLQDKYPHVIFWLKDKEGNNVLNNRFTRALPRLQHLQEAIPDATVLSFAELTPQASPEYIQLLSKTTLNYVDVSEAIVLDSNTGYAMFQQELNKFVRKARRNEHPVAIVRGNSESLNWLQNELADFKKAGLHIVLPRKKQF